MINPIIDLIYMACTVLLPVIPAYLLFRALDSAGSVSGPLLGLKLKLGGAFAGYFAVLVLIFVMYHVWHPTYGVWKIHGQVTDENGNQISPLDDKDVSLIPGNLQLYPDGSFDLTFAAARGDYPSLAVGHPNFQAVTMKLDPTAKTVNDDGYGHLTIVRPLSLHKLPPYTATGPAPTPVVIEQEPHR